MKIELRSRQLASGNRTLYLEFYEKGGKRHYESLNLFLIPEKSEEDRRVNEATLKKALQMKSERVLGIERKPEQREERKRSVKKLCEWMDEYLQRLKDEGKCSLAYQRHMRCTVNIVSSYLRYMNRPNLLMEKVTKSFYKHFLSYVKDVYRNTKSPDNPKPLSPKTMLLVQTDFNAIVNAAVKEGVLTKNPFYELEKTETFSKTPSEREFLTVEELRRMAKVTTGSPATKQTFMFCCFTGLRHSDLVALKWSDVRETDNGLQLYVASMQKTHKPCIVPLNAMALEWMPKRGTATSDTKVFQDVPTLGCANRALKHMARKVGITKTISFHCSRHTFATLILTAGSDIYTASKLLGHNDIHSTEIYANVVMEKKVDAVNLLNGIL